MSELAPPGANAFHEATRTLTEHIQSVHDIRRFPPLLGLLQRLFRHLDRREQVHGPLCLLTRHALERVELFRHVSRTIE